MLTVGGRTESHVAIRHHFHIPLEVEVAFLIRFRTEREELLLFKLLLAIVVGTLRHQSAQIVVHKILHMTVHASLTEFVSTVQTYPIRLRNV